MASVRKASPSQPRLTRGWLTPTLAEKQEKCQHQEDHMKWSIQSFYLSIQIQPLRFFDSFHD
jgi:hypothetical protein